MITLARQVHNYDAINLSFINPFHASGIEFTCNCEVSTYHIALAIWACLAGHRIPVECTMMSASRIPMKGETSLPSVLKMAKGSYDKQDNSGICGL